MVNASAKQVDPSFYDLKPTGLNYAIRSTRPERGEKWWYNPSEGVYYVKDRRGIQFSFHDPMNEVYADPKMGLEREPQVWASAGKAEPWDGMSLQRHAGPIATNPRVRGVLGALAREEITPDRAFERLYRRALLQQRWNRVLR